MANFSEVKTDCAITLSARVLLIALTLLWLAFLPCPALANIKLPSIIGDNMVLQKGRPLKFWGLSDPGEYVTVIMGEEKKGTIADSKGRWVITISPHRDGPSEFVIRGKNIITIKNVAWGDVWLCIGQTNVLTTVQDSTFSPEEMTKSLHPDIRLFMVKPDCSKDGLFEFDQKGEWIVCTPDSVKAFSAFAYSFGNEIHEKMQEPLGLIAAGRAGALMQTWISPDAMIKSKEFKGLPALNDENFSLLTKLQEELKETDQKEDPQTYKELTFKAIVFKMSSETANCSFNAMVSPLVPTALKGVVWYQGENDIGEPLRLRRLTELMLEDWRSEFLAPNLPFIFVQIPNIYKRNKDPEESQYADLREIQASVRKFPYAWVAVTIDTVPGINATPHPKDKREIAHRAALIALATQYRVPVKALSPFYDSMEVVDDKIKLHFRLGEPQLKVKGGTEPKGFAIAGEDRVFVWAKAEIDGDTINVWSDKVKKPVAVRYAWADNPECNVYSQDDLPLCPFRTDEWPRKKKPPPPENPL